MREKITEFFDLDAWKKSHEVVLAIYKTSVFFPKEEQFGLTNQMRRAAVSATSNLAEGFGRNSAKDKCQFYAIAKGSLLELQSQLITAKDLGYISQNDFNRIREIVLHAIRLTSGLVRSAVNRPSSS